MEKKFPGGSWAAATGCSSSFTRATSCLARGLWARSWGERFESIYPHIKMYFYAYLAVSAIDYFTHRRQIPSTSSFWNARMLVASSFPWMSIVIWFIPVALGFELGRLELFYSLVLTAIGFYLAFRMEEGLEQVEFRPASQAMVWLAFVAALITYIGFSFHVPENFFITPG